MSSTTWTARAIFAHAHGALGLREDDVAHICYGATVGMVVAMTLWGHAVSRLGPNETMLHVYLEPVSAVVIAALLLGESFGLLQALGALLTFVAVSTASTGRRPALRTPGR